MAVYLKKTKGRLKLEIRDNGKGITEKQIDNPKSFGLIGIRERALYLGGTIEFNGVQDEGTTMTLQIPLRDNSSDR